jgi:GWxTD domain-containing protein
LSNFTNVCNIRIYMKHSPLYLLWLLLLALACASPKSAVKPSVVNLSNMYNPLNTRLHPAFTIYHNLPSSSLLLIKIFPSELLYSGTIEPNKLLGLVRLKYVLNDITDPEKSVLADSGRITYSFERENADKRFITQISLDAQTGRKYQLMINTADPVRNEESLTYLYLDKTSVLSEQNFLVTDTRDNIPVFQPYVVGNSNFSLNHPDSKYDTIFVRFYGKEIPLPKPSFSNSREREFLERSDSLWILPFRKGLTYQLNYEGIYHFQLDTNYVDGLTLYNFGDSYPKVQEIKQLMEPLAYLATSVEYDGLKKATNQKLAVDDFWLDKAGNVEKARELIRVYYNRVFFSNYYFTSFKPGWKTDRGMIFIIYGPPQEVKVTSNQEKWIYYKNNYTTTVTFSFDHVPTPFALDNYILQRSDSYDTYWRLAVETWRKGNIYLIE